MSIAFSRFLMPQSGFTVNVLLNDSIAIYTSITEVKRKPSPFIIINISWHIKKRSKIPNYTFIYEISDLSCENAIKNTSENHPRAINIFNRK